MNTFVDQLRFPKPKKRERDVDYMLRVKELPCLMAYLGGCAGVVEADHVGESAVGTKSHDRETVPMCSLDHRHRHAFTGPFRGWTKEEMREWRKWAIRHTQGRLGYVVTVGNEEQSTSTVVE